MRARIQLCLHQDPWHAACSAGPSSAPGPLQTWVQRAEATMSHFLAGSGDHLSQKLAKGVSPREERPFRVATRVRSLWLLVLLNTAQHTVRPLPVSHPSSFSPVLSPFFYFTCFLFLFSLPLPSHNNLHPQKGPCPGTLPTTALQEAAPVRQEGHLPMGQGIKLRKLQGVETRPLMFTCRELNAHLKVCSASRKSCKTPTNSP